VSFGDIKVLSFNGNKITTTSGGGWQTKTKELKKKGIFYATQSKERHLIISIVKLGITT
jgi:dTDP-4-amino-4,6-dideoxygalactose transaminase